MADGEPGDQVERGVALIAALEHEELPLSAAVDRIETVTTNPATTRRVLDVAEERGLIERDGNAVSPRGSFVSFESDVVVREGEFTCQRCGAEISEGHVIQLDPGEVGPFGSSCIRKVTGRE
jgi:hypothetical protein